MRAVGEAGDHKTKLGRGLQTYSSLLTILTLVLERLYATRGHMPPRYHNPHSSRQQQGRCTVSHRPHSR